MIDENRIFDRILNFIEEAGRYALSKYNRPVASDAKQDKTIVTEVDLYISKLFYDSFPDIVESDDHLVLEEETAHKINYDEVRPLADYETLWSLDPIDGTFGFATGTPTWSISLGVLKKGKPWIGVVYIPPTNELYISRDNKSELIYRPFSAEQETYPFEDKGKIANAGRTVVFTQPYLANMDKVRDNYFLFTLRHSGVELIYSLKAGAVGSIGRPAIWDFLGSWPITVSFGLAWHDFDTGEPITTLSKEYFQDNWSLKKRQIVCRSGDFDEMKSLTE